MTVANKREQLKSFLDTANDNEIDKLYTIWGEITHETDLHELTDEQSAILEIRRSDVLAGKNVITGWEAMHNNIRKKRIA